MTGAYNLPHLDDLLKASETDNQAFVVVPTLNVSISQKISNMDNMLHRGYFPEVLKSNDQVAAVVLRWMSELVRECNGVSDAPYQPCCLEVSETNDEASGQSYVGHQYS